MCIASGRNWSRGVWRFLLGFLVHTFSVSSGVLLKLDIVLISRTCCLVLSLVEFNTLIHHASAAVRYEINGQSQSIPRLCSRNLTWLWTTLMLEDTEVINGTSVPCLVVSSRH